MSAGLVAAGFVYFWTRLRIDPTPRRDPYIVSVAISVAEVIFDGVLGLTLWLGPLVAAHYYQALARPWGPDMRTDQVIGAGVLWIGGDLAGLPFLGAVMARMSREDAELATAIDAELDALDATATSSESPDVTAHTAAAPDHTPAGSSGPGRSRLWWEDVPEIAQRFRNSS